MGALRRAPTAASMTLGAMLELKEPAAAHRLSILKKLEQVTLRAEGNTHWCRLNLSR